MMIIRGRLKPATTYRYILIVWLIQLIRTTQKSRCVWATLSITFPFRVAVDRPRPKSRAVKFEPRYHEVAFWVLVSHANPISMQVLGDINSKAKHTCRSMILIATPTMSTTEVLQEMLKALIYGCDISVHSNGVNHGLDQGRRLSIRISTIGADGCIGTISRSKSEIVMVSDRAIIIDTNAVPGWSRTTLWLQLCRRRGFRSSIHSRSISSQCTVCQSLSFHRARLHGRQKLFRISDLCLSLGE